MAPDFHFYHNFCINTSNLRDNKLDSNPLKALIKNSNSLIFVFKALSCNLSFAFTFVFATNKWFDGYINKNLQTATKFVIYFFFKIRSMIKFKIERLKFWPNSSLMSRYSKLNSSNCILAAHIQIIKTFVSSVKTILR